jgi:hypothetical protein
MNEAEISALAKRLARGIFETPELRLGERVTRLAFKGGSWPNNETDLGGVSEWSLAKRIADLLAVPPSSGAAKHE